MQWSSSSSVLRVCGRSTRDSAKGARRRRKRAASGRSAAIDALRQFLHTRSNWRVHSATGIAVTSAAAAAPRTATAATATAVCVIRRAASTRTRRGPSIRQNSEGARRWRQRSLSASTRAATGASFHLIRGAFSSSCRSRSRQDAEGAWRRRQRSFSAVT